MNQQIRSFFWGQLDYSSFLNINLILKKGGILNPFERIFFYTS